MAQQDYNRFSVNPHDNQGANPYGDGTYVPGANPYGGQSTAPSNALPALHQQDSNYSQASDGPVTNVPHTNVALQQAYQAPPVEQHGAQPLDRDDFLSRADGTRQRINELANDITAITNVHQHMLSSPDNRSSSELESIITRTQIRNTQIKDEIQFLERDASRPLPNGTFPPFKKPQIVSIKNQFKATLKDFEDEERLYRDRYREAIGRQYRIVNPDATDAEVQEAANADWGSDGVFSQALKSNRSGQASSVLGAVRARHNDIQRINKTMIELAELFEQLNTQVVYQEAQVAQIDEQTTQVHQDAEQANVHLDKGIVSARRARKLKWWTLGVVVLILAIIALALGIYFGAVKPKQNN